MNSIEHGQMIYERLEQLGILEVEESETLESRGFMPLHIDRLSENTFALAHYFEQNGDLVPDPDMQIRVCHITRTAEAFTYQDQFCYREAIDENGMVNMRDFVWQNQFLDTWTKNLIAQGFKAKREGETA